MSPSRRQMGHRQMSVAFFLPRAVFHCGDRWRFFVAKEGRRRRRTILPMKSLVVLKREASSGLRYVCPYTSSLHRADELHGWTHQPQRDICTKVSTRVSNKKVSLVPP